MHVHIVRPNDGWILNRVGDLIDFPGVTRGTKADPKADLNFYCNYFYLESRTKCDVAWMTHLPAVADDGGFRRKRFHEKAKLATACIAMCKQTAANCPPEKTWIWGGAPEKLFCRPGPLVLGVCAKLSRRKLPERIEALRSIPGVEVRVTGGSLTQEQVRDFYLGLDYLVITSDTEGGPYPVLEALACGIPVIAPNVGWSWEYPVIRYDDTSDLVRQVSLLVPPVDSWGDASESLRKILAAVVQGQKPGKEVPTFRLHPSGDAVPYFYHKHNCGLPAALRRTERTVELALADLWLRRLADNTNLVEVGAVTPYYWPGRVPTVIDPADKQANLRKSVLDIDLSGKDVLSVSTIEHVGEKRYGLSESATPLDALSRIMKARRFLVTFPRGVSEVLDRQVTMPMDCNVYSLVRTDGENWEYRPISEGYRPYGTGAKPWANAICLLERGNLL